LIENTKPLQIAILSGKGGTGKTTFTASIAMLLKNKIVIDCDVDAANLYLLLNPEIDTEKEFYGGKIAKIDIDKCSSCGLCGEICRFDAIDNFRVDQISCEGCGFCVKICPEQAITFEPHKSGDFYIGELQDNSKFFYAKLLPGQGNSGKLVNELKKTAANYITEQTRWIIIDGPPGIGCPVNASLAGADYVVIIAESTLSGIHDLKRLLLLLKSFKYECGIVINKFNLNIRVTEMITILARSNNVDILELFPFHLDFVKSLQSGKTIIEYNPEIKKQIEDMLTDITDKIIKIKRS
jgi:MinD superfamily P-loop ATPase